MSAEDRERLRVAARGAVQGVGFRPFIYRLATEMDLTGWVNNSAQGVFIEVEGPRPALEAFLLRIGAEKPPAAYIQSLESSYLDAVGFAHFTIRESDAGGAKTTLILPDLAICPDCRRELLDPADRRYRYPFINCTNCGPRFSIIERLPYDRPNTTMKGFPLCDACRAEYENPLDRRFHAQPTACPACGPHLEEWGTSGEVLSTGDAALRRVERAIDDGRIVAIKGLGGFHLLCDARHDSAVQQLRTAKHREEKPFAVMVPSLEAARELCEVSAAEARLLTSPEFPIVLLRRRANADENLSFRVAPMNPYLGVMLPYTPLHVLLLADLGFPVVATSGNLSDEPICTDEREAITRLAGIADVFLVHNRPIARHVDDSVARIVLDREMVLRRARGYAPLPLTLKEEGPTILAVGAHLKNTVALSVGRQVFGSQHIGDLETAEASAAFQRVAADLQQLYDAHPSAVACDLHPDYLSTQYARRSGLPVVPVQHHYAHVLSCMAENDLSGGETPILGVSWDGTGYGTDGTVWGGEFLVVNEGGYERAAHLRTFLLPGGEKAVKEPRRCALGLLCELYGVTAVFARDDEPPVSVFSRMERNVLKRMIETGTNTPRTSSAGRLFDAVATLVGLRPQMRFEGQAAMELEFALHGSETDEHYPFAIVPPSENGGPAIVDWGEMIAALLADKRDGVPVGILSAAFHNTLTEMVVAAARTTGAERVALTGGCFQNRYLLERTVTRLRREGFRPYWHQRIPPNDGGIAFGQAAAAASEILGRADGELYPRRRT